MSRLVTEECKQYYEKQMTLRGVIDGRGTVKEGSLKGEYG
jgi:hypothetical protein